jgi:hypothetical protein
MPSRWQLSAPESHVLQYRGSCYRTELFKLAVKELVTRRVLRVQRIQPGGLSGGRPKYAVVDGPLIASEVPPPLSSVLGVYKAHRKSLNVHEAESTVADQVGRRSPPVVQSRYEGRAGGPKRARVLGLVPLTVLCLSVAFAGCSEGDQPRRAEADEAGRAGAHGVGALTGCLRDLGASVEEGPLYSFPGAAIANYEVTLKSGGFAGVEVFRSETEADGRLNTGPVAARKGKLVVLYGGRSPEDAALLEGCLRASATGEGLRRGGMARRVRQDRARLEEVLRRQRQRSYTSPAAITDVLKRLASYRRYTLYYPGRRVGRLPLTGVASRMQPPAYGTTRRLFRPLISPTFGFVYGSCEPPFGTDGGCGTPVQVQNYESCAVNPNLYGASPNALTERIRGVPVLRTERGRRLTIFTGKTTITISGDSDVAARVAATLRSTDGTIGPRGKLPPPVSGALEGRLRCRRPTKAELDGAP